MQIENATMSNAEIIDFLVKTNDPNYQLSKINEECLELGLALTQRLNKGERGASNDDIIDEIGDLEIRLQIAKKIFGEKQVNDRIQFKLDKYKEYASKGLYVGTI